MVVAIILDSTALDATLNLQEITENKGTYCTTLRILSICGKLYWASDLAHSTKKAERENIDYKRLKRCVNQLQRIKLIWILI